MENIQEVFYYDGDVVSENETIIKHISKNWECTSILTFKTTKYLEYVLSNNIYKEEANWLNNLSFHGSIDDLIELGPVYSDQDPMIERLISDLDREHLCNLMFCFAQDTNLINKRILRSYTSFQFGWFLSFETKEDIGNVLLVPLERLPLMYKLNDDEKIISKFKVLYQIPEKSRLQTKPPLVSSNQPSQSKTSLNSAQKLTKMIEESETTAAVHYKSSSLSQASYGVAPLINVPSYSASSESVSAGESAMTYKSQKEWEKQLKKNDDEVESIVSEEEVKVSSTPVEKTKASVGLMAPDMFSQENSQIPKDRDGHVQYSFISPMDLTNEGILWFYRTGINTELRVCSLLPQEHTIEEDWPSHKLWGLFGRGPTLLELTFLFSHPLFESRIIHLLALIQETKNLSIELGMTKTDTFSTRVINDAIKQIDSRNTRWLLSALPSKAKYSFVFTLIFHSVTVLIDQKYKKSPYHLFSEKVDYQEFFKHSGLRLSPTETKGIASGIMNNASLTYREEVLKALKI